MGTPSRHMGEKESPHVMMQEGGESRTMPRSLNWAGGTVCQGGEHRGGAGGLDPLASFPVRYAKARMSPPGFGRSHSLPVPLGCHWTKEDQKRPNGRKISYVFFSNITGNQ